jgi:hypothetical protein
LSRINQIKDDVCFLKLGEDDWKAAVTESAAEQNKSHVRIPEEIGNIQR